MNKPLALALVTLVFFACSGSDTTSPGSSGSSSRDAGGTEQSSQGDGGGPSDAAAADVTAAKQCTGTPTPCAQLASAMCAMQLGCSDQSSCTGSSFTCDSFNGNDTLCIYQQGCYYSTLNMTCSGFSAECNTFMNSTSCVRQEGCNWSSKGCGGTPTADCSLLTVAKCTGTPGCVVK
jgi:hypothetical protein